MEGKEALEGVEKYINMIKEFCVDYAPSVFGAIITLIVGFWIAGFVTKMVKKVLVKRNVDESLVPFLGSLVGIVLKNSSCN